MKPTVYLLAIGIASAATWSSAQDSTTGDAAIDLKDGDALAAPDVKLDVEAAEKVPLPALPEPKTSSGSKSLTPVSDTEFDDLSDEQKKEVATLLGDAARFVQGIRLQEALSKLWEAEQIAPNIFQIHNLRGAAYTKMRDFEKARASFEKAIALVPNAFHARFNLTEIDYVTGNYETAETEFVKLLEAFPKTDVATRRLIEYKIVICKLKQGDSDGAKKMIGAYSYLDDTPIYYVANAAVAFSKEDRDDAESWITSARKIYPAAQMEIFLDALIEAGWIETL